MRPWWRALFFACTAALATGCVTRHGPSPLIDKGPIALRTTGWMTDVAEVDGAIAPDAWPVRLPMPTEALTEPRSSSYQLYLPQRRAPEPREPLGRRGQGVVERVALEQITDASSIERLRREQGFVEWLVVATIRREIDVRVFPESLPPVSDVRLPRAFEAAETSFVLHLPETAPRGLVLQLTNLAGNTDTERRLTQRFRDAGWAVLSTYMPEGWIIAGGELNALDDPESLGRRIALSVDDRLAEWAFGVEAILEDLAERRPEVPQQPLVAIGNSIGAVALPAIAARLDQPFSAVVLVGGGADTLEIMRGTTLGNSVTPLTWADGRRPSAAAWDAIGEAYRAASRLDPMRTAPLLRGTPVLQLHAQWDAIVPASTGVLLWEALGRPERWNYRSGHLGLFLFWLPRELNRIVRWVDDAITRERSSSGAASGQGSDTPDPARAP